MRGDDRVRFCGQCQQHVYNLSAMSRAEGEALIARHEGRICVNLYRRADGTVLTTDCPVGVRRLQVKRVRRVALGAAGVGLIAALAVWAWPRREPCREMGRAPYPGAVRGKIAAPQVGVPTP
jgi:hypothetical protein